MAPGQRVSDVQGVALELALRVRLDVAQLLHVQRVQHWLGHFQPHRRVDLVDVQQVGLGADKRHQRHHNRFPNRVNRRVGHLRKQLLEIVVERLVLVGQHGQRAVVAHGTRGFFAIGGHGRHQKLDVFLGVAKGLLTVKQRVFNRVQINAGLGRHIVKPDAQVFHPLFVRLAVRQRGLDFFVINDAALFQINQEHLAGLQTPFTDDFVFRNRQYTGLGRHDDQIAVSHAVTCRTQAIAVQRGTNLATIGEHDGRRTIPGFQHGRMVFIKRFATFVHGGVLLPGFGNHHHHGLADRVTGHRQQLQAVVKRGGVGLVGKADRVKLLQVSAQHGRRHHAFTRFHPVVVALDGVDLAVVRDIAVRMGQWPLGEGVG